MFERRIEHTGRTAQVWNWTQINSPESILKNLYCDKLNRGRARILAQRLNSWHEENPSESLWIVAGSGGTKILWMACADYHFPNNLQFEQIVLLSGALSIEDNLYVLHERSRHGYVLNYCSNNDEILGAMLGRLLVPDAIGLDGYPEGTTGVRQLCWGERMGQGGLNNT